MNLLQIEGFTRITCPRCKDGHLEVISYSNNRFILRCDNYPKCGYFRELDKNDICPKCNKGKLTGRVGKSNIDFLGCSRYPICSYARSADRPGICPKCGSGNLICKDGKYGLFISCSNYPNCTYTRTATQNEKRKYELELRSCESEIYEHGLDEETAYENLINFISECGNLKDGDEYVGFRD